MRKFLIPLAAAASALAIAAPASAQWNGYGNLSPVYGAPGYAYGYGAVRNLRYRVNAIQQQIASLARYRMITPHEYRRLRNDSRDVERKLRHDVRDGRRFSQREMYRTERRIARLEQKVARDVRDGRRWGHRW